MKTRKLNTDIYKVHIIYSTSVCVCVCMYKHNVGGALVRGVVVEITGEVPESA